MLVVVHNDNTNHDDFVLVSFGRNSQQIS